MKTFHDSCFENFIKKFVTFESHLKFKVSESMSIKANKETGAILNSS